MAEFDPFADFRMDGHAVIVTGGARETSAPASPGRSRAPAPAS